MKKNKLEKGMVLFHPKKKKYIQIKEITYAKDEINSAQYFVCSGDCDYFSDSQTTIERQVIYQTEIEQYFYLDPISAEF